MGQRYTRISTFPENLYVNCSPIIISAGALLKDNKTGKVLAQFKFKNLSDNIITAVKLCLKSFDISGIELDGVEEYQYLDISVKPTESFGDDKAITLPDANTRNCTVIIKEVIFASVVPWKNDGSIECDPIPLQIPLNEVLNNSRLIEQYRRDTTEHSKYKPAKYLDLWLCSCGTANKRPKRKCSNCGIELQKLLESTNLEVLEKNYNTHQERQRRAANERQQVEKKKHRIRWATVACVLLLTGLFFLVNNFLIPETKYRVAEQLIDQGEYEAAIVAFDQLSGYRDSEQRVEEAKYIIAAEESQVALALYKSGVWTPISAGSQHTVALTKNGTAIAVGDNYYGQCNVSHWENIDSISAGSLHTIGLKADGTVVAVGYNGSGQCNVYDWKDITSVSAGSTHTVGLKEDGTVVAVGNNKGGQCEVSDWSNIISISAGGAYTVGLKADGTVVAAGSNSDGQCNVSSWRDIIAVSAGRHHTVGLKADGTVVAVGFNGAGQCNVSDWKDIVSISVGDNHTVGLKADGTVVAVGYNRDGQCDVLGWKDIIYISAGMGHTVAVRADADVFAVGESLFGRCDVSNWADIPVPN